MEGMCSVPDTAHGFVQASAVEKVCEGGKRGPGDFYFLPSS